MLLTDVELTNVQSKPRPMFHRFGIAEYETGPALLAGPNFFLNELVNDEMSAAPSLSPFALLTYLFSGAILKSAVLNVG